MFCLQKSSRKLKSMECTNGKSEYRSGPYSKQNASIIISNIGLLAFFSFKIKRASNYGDQWVAHLICPSMHNCFHYTDRAGKMPIV